MLMRAVGMDPADALMPRPMTGAQDARYYSALGGEDIDHYERSVEAVEEQELAFRLALEKGLLCGPLARRFRARYGDDPARRDDLVRRYLSLSAPGTVPVELRAKLLAILRDALGS